MNSAGHTSVKTWVRFNTTRKLSFKENRRKKNPKPKPQLQPPWCAQLNPFELSAQIIFLLNHEGVCLGYLCLSAMPPTCRNQTRLLPGWTVEKTEHGGHCQPGGPGVGQIGAGVARAWLAPKRCWQQIQRSRDQPSYCKVTPPALVLPAARALLGFEDSPKKRPFLVWPLLGTGQGEAGALKLRKHWGHVARSPYNTLHGLSVNSPCNKPNSLYMAKILTWRKASDLIFMKRSRAWNPTSSYSGLTP